MKLNRKFKVLTAGLVLVVALGAVGCGKNETGSGYSEIDAAKTIELAGETKNTLVIDVRDEEAYKAGHLANAINIPFDQFEGKISELEGYKDQNIILICNSGNKSGQAAQMLVDNGFTKVYNATDGMTDYAYETVTYTNVTGSEFEKLAKEKTDAVIIDLRDSKDFDESSIENAKHMSSDDFATEADAQLTDKNQEILLYCNTGTRTANAAKILEEKGYTNVVNSIDGVKEYNFDLKQK